MVGYLPQGRPAPREFEERRLPVSWSQGFAATMRQSFEEWIPVTAGRMVASSLARPGGIDSKVIDEMTWRNSEFYRSTLDYDTDMTWTYAAMLAENEDLLTKLRLRAQHSSLGGFGSLVASLTGGIADPTNFLGFGAVSRMSKMRVLGKTLGRNMIARRSLGVAAIQAVEGAITESIAGVTLYPLKKGAFQEDYTFNDYASNVVIAMVGGGLFGGATGAYSGVRRLRMKDKMKLLQRGLDDAIADLNGADAEYRLASEAQARDAIASIEGVDDVPDLGPAPARVEAEPVSEFKPREAEPTNVEAEATVAPVSEFKPREAEPTNVEAEATVEPVARAVTGDPKLPRNLAGEKSRWQKFLLKFESDIDRALFITSKKPLSRHDAKYRAWLKSNGLSNADIDRLGQKIRSEMRRIVPETQGNVPRIFRGKGEPMARAAPAPAPAPAPVAKPIELPPVPNDTSSKIKRPKPSDLADALAPHKIQTVRSLSKTLASMIEKRMREMVSHLQTAVAAGTEVPPMFKHWKDTGAIKDYSEVPGIHNDIMMGRDIEGARGEAARELRWAATQETFSGKVSDEWGVSSDYIDDGFKARAYEEIGAIREEERLRADRPNDEKFTVDVQRAFDEVGKDDAVLMKERIEKIDPEIIKKAESQSELHRQAYEMYGKCLAGEIK